MKNVVHYTETLLEDIRGTQWTYPLRGVEHNIHGGNSETKTGTKEKMQGYRHRKL